MAEALRERQTDHDGEGSWGWGRHRRGTRGDGRQRHPTRQGVSTRPGERFPVKWMVRLSGGGCMDGLPGGGSFSLGRRSAAASTINTGLDRGGDHRQTTASLARIIGGGGGDQDCETVGRTRGSSNASSWRGPRERSSRVGEADAEPAAAGDGERDVKLSLCVSVCLLDDDFRRRPGATFAMAFGSVDPPYRLSAPSALHRDTTARSLPEYQPSRRLSLSLPSIQQLPRTASSGCSMRTELYICR